MKLFAAKVSTPTPRFLRDARRRDGSGTPVALKSTLLPVGLRWPLVSKEKLPAKQTGPEVEVLLGRSVGFEFT